MSTKIRNRIREVFVAVCEHQPADQPRVLNELCGDDAHIKSEVQSLLSFHQNDTFLSASAMSDAGFADAADSQVSMPPGTKIGRCSITRLIGTGGMGMVYEARQDSPDRKVALKIMRAGGTSSAMVKRFAQEARALAILQHPGIAQVYDAGRELTAAGPVPYLVMELVEGITLNTFINRHKLALPAKLKLILQICDAVAHAHLRGVIHRDIKPTNILVDETGRARILDFGIARLAESDARATISTSGGQVLGTLAYMSPEQAGGDPSKIDTRADVYSLGVVLYEVLTGKLPIDVTQVSIAEAVRRIRELDSPPPSSHASECRGELDTIAFKALSKDPARRYQSAQALAEDIRRYLTGHPILARGDSALYVLSKHVRRNKIPVAAACVILVGMVAFSIYASIVSTSERAARTRAEISLAVAKEQTRRADESAAQLERELHSRNVENGRLLGRGGHLAAAEEVLWLEHAAWPDSETTRWALRDLYNQFHCIRTIPGPVDPHSPTMHANGRWIAYVSGDQIRVSDSINGNDVSSLSVTNPRTVWMAFSNDGTHLVRIEDTVAPSIFVYRVDSTGTLSLQWEQLLAASDPVTFQLDPAGTGIAIGYSNGRVSILSLSAGVSQFDTLVPINSDARLRAMCYNVDAKQILIATNYTVYALDIAPEPKTRRIAVQTGFILCIEPTPDGMSVLTGSRDQRIRCFDLSSGALINQIQSSNGSIRTLEISPDGKMLASQGWWRNDLWDAKTLQRLNDINDQPIGGTRLGFSPDSLHLYSDSAAGIRIWTVNKAPRWQDLYFHKKYVYEIAAASRSPRVVTLGAREQAVLWDSTTMKSLGPLGSSGLAWKAALTADGSIAALVSENGILDVVTTDTKVNTLHLKTNTRALDIHFVNHDRLLAISTPKPSIQFRNPKTGELVHDVELPNSEILEMTPSEDGKLLFIQQRDLLQSLDVEKLTLTPLPQNEIQSGCVAPNRDGTQVASGLFTGEVEIWDTLTRKRLHNMVGHREVVSDIAYSSDFKYLASCAGDGIMLWDAQKGSQLLVVRELQPAEVQPIHPTFITFVEQDTKLLVGYSDGKLETYDLLSFDREVEANARKPVDIAQAAGVSPPPTAESTDGETLKEWFKRVSKALSDSDPSQVVPQGK